MTNDEKPVTILNSLALSLEFQKAMALKARQRHLAETRSFKEKYETLLAIQKRSSAILQTRGTYRRVWPAWDE